MSTTQDSYFDNLQTFFKILKRRFIYIIIPVFAVSLGAAIYAKRLPNIYRATATILTSGNQQMGGLSSEIGALLQNPRLSPIVGMLGARQTSPGQQLIPMLKSRTVAEDVVRHFNLAKGLPVEKAALSIRGNADFKSDEMGLVHIFYESTDPKQAADIANYYPVALRNHLNKTLKIRAKRREAELEDSIARIKKLIDESKRLFDEAQRRFSAVQSITMLHDSLLQQYDLTKFEEDRRLANFHVLDSALIPETPVRPHRGKITLVGALVGLAMGILLAFALEALDNRIHETEAVEDKLGMQILGTLAVDAEGKNISPEWMNNSDQEKIIAKSIEGLFTNNNNYPRKIVFSAVDDNPEKAILIGKIGQTLFEQGKKVLVINYNTNSPLPLTSDPTSPTFDTKNVSHKGQFLNPGEFSGYDYVLVDAPSGIMSSSLFDLVQWADVTLPIVKIGNTSLNELALHKASLDKITDQVKAITIIPPSPSSLSEIRKILSHRISWKKT
ncbi:MAG TPA: hypothetical protein EYP21_08000 [Syntrophaceae bacterium]|nr:hypothetical protein [Syntrophaceae bacterium]